MIAILSRDLLRETSCPLGTGSDSLWVTMGVEKGGSHVVNKRLIFFRVTTEPQRCYICQVSHGFYRAVLCDTLKHFHHLSFVNLWAISERAGPSTLRHPSVRRSDTNLGIKVIRSQDTTPRLSNTGRVSFSILQFPIPLHSRDVSARTFLVGLALRQGSHPCSDEHAM